MQSRFFSRHIYQILLFEKEEAVYIIEDSILLEVNTVHSNQPSYTKGILNNQYKNLFFFLLLCFLTESVDIFMKAVSFWGLSLV